MLQLFSHGDDCAPFGETDAKQLRQLRYHERGLVITFAFDHPDDRVQSIIQKMRINLALKGIQLAFSSLVLLNDNLFHQRIDLLIRFLNRISQMTDLQRSSYINLRFFTRLIFFHGIIELHDRPGNTHRDNAIYNHDHHKGQQHEEDDKILNIDHPMSKRRFIRNNSDKLPAGITDSIHHHFPASSVKYLIVDSFFVASIDNCVLFINTFTDLNLSWMINYLPAAVTKIVILSILRIIYLFHHP